MASVELSETWIHDAADLTDCVASDGFGEGGPTDTVVGEVRTYAGGRRRVVKRPGRARTYRRRFPAVSDEWLTWMDDHLGETVVVRDPRGRVFHAVYFTLEVPDRPGSGGPSVTVEFQAVTGSFEV